MNKIPLMENACKDLLQYGVFDARARAKYLVKRFLLRRRVAGEDLIFWPTGLLAAGLWQCRKELVKTEAAAAQRAGAEASELADEAALAAAGRMIGMIEESLTAYYMRWIKKGMPLAVLDDLLAGETLLCIYGEIENGASDFGGKLTKDRVKAALDRMASYAAEHPKDAAGSFFYRPANGEKTVFVDSVGLTAPFLYRYGEMFDKQEYRELALRQITNFLSCGMDEATKLPYHGYDTANACKYGIIGWGRSVGWLLRGMTGCMTSEYGREKVGAPYMALVERALAYQRLDGCFSWQLQALEGPVDTSVTGMICTALKEGMELGILAGEAYESALSAGKDALEKSVREGRVYDCSGECEGFSCYPQRYDAYPWSLGPALTVLQADQEEFEE